MGKCVCARGGTHSSLEVPRGDDSGDEGDTSISACELGRHVHLDAKAVVAPTQRIVDKVCVDKIRITLG
jgi:hypothetical protein